MVAKRDTEEAYPALKEIFNRARLRHIAEQMSVVQPRFDSRKFLQLATRDLDSLSIMQRLRQTAVSLGAVLPERFPDAVADLKKLAPRVGDRFVAMTLSEFVAVFGLEHFDASMRALRHFTVFGSGEFAIRHFLKRDFDRTLAVMVEWAGHENEYVRRLASEGSRPRLPWSFKLDAVIADPSKTWPILDALKTDPDDMVRRSVANHLNDITKDHPDWVIERVSKWSLKDPRTAGIVRHALRTLIKNGDPRALALIGATGKAQVRVDTFDVKPRRVKLGDSISLSFALTGTAAKPQNLVIDYAIHYVKKGGATSRKVFKLRQFEVLPAGTVRVSRNQTLKNFTTRVHYSGRHDVELLVNGECLARSFFYLAC
jgi:3-methyladenine DNA glycosylase AlkC